MLRLSLPSKKNLKKARSNETELWLTTRADARHLQGIPSVLAAIKINALQAMYGENVFKFQAPP